MAALIEKRTILLPPPTNDDRRAHDQRIADTVGLGPLAIPLAVLKKLPAFVNAGAAFSCIIGRAGAECRLIDAGAERSYSLALDLGTTNLVALLYDNMGRRMC